MFGGIRRLTPEMIRNSKYHFNIVYKSNKYLFIKLSKKDIPYNLDEIPDYDKNVNPFLIPTMIIKENIK
tara:strand:+ start:263 stop:469 length:207 start_codon:yes stop_codon:yes gene_type:complete